MRDTLIKLGLSDKEAAVYLAALELGEDTVQNIAEKAAVNRATTYVILEKLMSLGLASTLERGKKTMFIAENPTELNNLIAEQRREIDTKEKYLGDVMSQLKAIYNGNSNKPAVRYFEGKDGLIALERYGYDQFKPGTEMLTIIPTDIIEDIFPTPRKQAINERVRLGIKSRTIYTHRDGPMGEDRNKEELREAIYLPREQLPIDVTIQIYEGWGIKFFNFNGEPYFGVLIQNPDIARNMKVMFDLAWIGANQAAAQQ